MVGNSSRHAIDGVRFEGFTIDGAPAMSLADLHIVNNTFLRNVSFSRRPLR
jgi:hypothetical protein